MKFVKVDEDSYRIENVNLDTIRRIGSELSYVDEDSRFDDVDTRREAIGRGFTNAYEKFSQPETSVDESVETE